MESDLKPKVEFRFVLIDDNPFDAKLIEMSLRTCLACHIVVVDSRQAFLSELDHARPDVIISDVILPSFDGFAALALARQHCSSVPFVFCSSTGSYDIKAKALTQGAKAWVSKNDLERLVVVVRELCGEMIADGE